MNRGQFIQRLRSKLTNADTLIDENFVLNAFTSNHTNQQHTNDAFSEKWQKYENSIEKERLFEFQRQWYLQLYGFNTEIELATYLRSKNVIFDAGCGLGYKSAWFASLSLPSTSTIHYPLLAVIVRDGKPTILFCPAFFYCMSSSFTERAGFS